MRLEIFHIKYHPLYLFFIFILSMSFGTDYGLHQRMAPFFGVFSLLIITTSNQKIYTGVLKSLILFVIITTVSSVNFIYFDTRRSYIVYLFYSNSIYFAALFLFVYINKRPESIKIIKVFIIVFFIIGMYSFYDSHTALDQDFDELYKKVNNAFYYVLMPLPLIFLFKNKIFKSIVLIIALAICILSMKRSAIIVISLISLVFFYIEFIRGEKKMKSIFFLMIIVIALVYMVDFSSIFERLDYVTGRLYNIQDDGGSGRMTVLDRFFDNDYKDLLHFPSLFIGNGFAAYNDKYNFIQSSHNDWIEILYSFGIIGLLNLFYFFSLMLKNFKVIVRGKIPMITAYLSAIIIFVFYSLVGGSFYFMYLSFSLFCFIGVTEAMLKNKIDVL